MFPGMPLPSSTFKTFSGCTRKPGLCGLWAYSVMTEHAYLAAAFSFPECLPIVSPLSLRVHGIIHYTWVRWQGVASPHRVPISCAHSDATLFYQPSLSKHKSKDKVGKNFKTTITGHKSEPEVILTTGPYVSARSHTYKPGSGSSLFKWLLDLNSAKLLGNWVLFSPHDQLSHLKTTSLIKAAISTSLLLIDAHFLYLQPLLPFWITEPHIKLTTWHLYLDVSKEPQTWSG